MTATPHAQAMPIPAGPDARPVPAVTTKENAMTMPLAVEHIDPRTLLVDLNLPGRDEADEDLAASIKALGVLQPIICYRTADWHIRVRHGHRRTLAAIDAGLDTVPVLVVADEAAGTAAEIERILSQYDENTHRRSLGAAQETHVVAQLLDLGLSAEAVHKRARMPKAKIQAAQAVRNSTAASHAAAKYDLTLDQAAALADFDGDDQAVRVLIDAARQGDGTFRHQEQQLRDRRAEREAIATRRIALEAAGIKVADTWPGWEHDLSNWATPDGSRLTPETHQHCPGHTAVVHAAYGTDTTRVSYFCADPRRHRHVRFTSPGSGQGLSLDQQRDQRRQTRENNQAWRSAAKVRCRFLRDFLARKELPANAMPVIIGALASGDSRLRRGMERGHTAARDLLGIAHSASQWGPDRVAPVLDAIGKASRQRALVITLGLVLAAYEDATYPEMWRSPGSHQDTAAYFRLLASWGYQLSEIEQLITDADEAAACQ